MKDRAAKLECIFLTILIAVCFIDCGLRGFPALPSYKSDITKIADA